MDPEDVLIEAIAAASFYGDSPGLRESQCHKLRESIEAFLAPVLRKSQPRIGSDEDLHSRRN